MKEKVKATKDRKSRASSEKVEISSGNVFVDLGFQDAEERLLKAKLATKIAQLIEKKGWTQAQTAERTALDQPKVSRLLRGQRAQHQTAVSCAMRVLHNDDYRTPHVYYFPSGVSTSLAYSRFTSDKKHSLRESLSG